MNSWRERAFIATAIISVLIAIGAVARLAMGGRIVYPFYFAFAWVILIVVALVVFRRRALWLLLGAPLALGPAILIYVYVATCVPTKSCL